MPGARSLEGLIVAGPHAVSVNRSEDAAGSTLQMSHDGYERRFGFVHHRTLTLSRDGTRLSGEDQLARSGRKAAGSGDFAIRFHLHPQVRLAEASAEAVALVLPAGEVWWFSARGAVVEIEESVFFASPEGLRQTQQIVLHGRAAQNPTVNWSLTRETRETDPE